MKDGRFDAFYALELGKQQRIISAALAEFTKNGFKRASTNTIAAQAKIGKGMLFYYFGNKEQLFTFLCEYTIAFVRHEFIDKINDSTGDFIERQRLLAAAKQKAIEKQPQIFTFFENFYRPENAEDAAKYTDILAKHRTEAFQKLYSGLDYSLFRPDIEPESAMQYINWLMDGYAAHIERKIAQNQLDMHDKSEWEQYDVFINNLKKLFYR